MKANKLFALAIALASLLIISCEKKHEDEQFTIKVESNTPACSVAGGGTYDKGSVITISAIPANGYRFVRWNDDNTTNPRNITVEYSTTFIAMFEQTGGGSSSISAPTGVTASIETYDGVDYILVQWNSVSNAVKYKVYYSTSSNGSYEYIGYAEETYGYVEASNSDNYFKVTAVNANGDESNLSSYAYCHYSSGGGDGGDETTVPDAPTGVTATNVGTTALPQVKISWNSVSNATSYKVYRSSSASGTYSQLGSSTSSTYAYDDNPMSGYNYYKVKAVNSAGESSYSSYAYFNYTSGGGTSYSPCPPTVNVSGTTSQTVTWTSSTSSGCGTPTSYEVYKYDPCSENWELKTTTTSHSYSVSSSAVNPGINRYAVKAINNVGDAANYGYSSSVSLAKPSTFNVQKLGNDGIKFTWSAVAKATGYKIYSCSTANGTYVLFSYLNDFTGTEQIYSFPGASGTTYYFKIKAVYDCGTSPIESDFTTYKSVTF